MAKYQRHTGRLSNTGQKCVVVFRELPDDTESALVVQPDQLPDMYHDNLMDVLKSPESQNTYDLFKVLQRRQFSDGSPMLTTLHNNGFIKKVATTNVTLLPLPNSPCCLADVNKFLDGENPTESVLNEDGEVKENSPTLIEDMMNDRTDDELAKVEKTPAIDAATVKTTDAISTHAEGDPVAIAAGLIVQAELLESDALKLRNQAYDLDPETKPTKGRPKLSDEEKARRQQQSNKKRREAYAKKKKAKKDA